jgi:NAD(P)-dependent dehydrogenase (short-subunit alcohol dehydrogenase family)
MDLKLSGKRVLVTGALGGVGLAIVRGFVDEGAQVVATDLAETAGVWEGVAGVSYLPAELRDTDAIAGLAASAADILGGPIEICVNNAAVTHRADVLDMDWTDFDRVYEINLRAPFVLGQAVARALVGAGATGTIVNIGSVNAQLALPDNAAYVASKGGLLQLTRAMAIALAPRGIRVNMVAPGSIDTPLQRAGQSRSPALRARVLSRTPLGRLGEPEEVADAVLYMASDRSSYVTGECLFVDGGRLPLNFTMPGPDPEN